MKYPVCFLIAITILGLVVPQTSEAQLEEWKTYYSPEYKFTIQYPDYPYMDFDVLNNSTWITLYSNKLIDYHLNMELGIKPLNTSEHVNLLSYVKDIFEHKIANYNGYYKVLQNITSTEYASYPAYTFTYSSNSEAVNPNDHNIHRVVYQLHSDMIYEFFMGNPYKDYRGEEFDRFVNSIKFFD